MDASHASSAEPVLGPLGVNNFPRRGTASSVNSDPYNPLPAGRWLLKFHGSCPRCHHQHNAVNIEVEVSHDAVSKVKCQNCLQNWLALGGRNSTQISLLSTLTTVPDPVESEVRSALINMVKSATAIASPVLSDIPEVPSQSGSNEHIAPLPTGHTFLPPSRSSAPSIERTSSQIQSPRTGYNISTGSNATSRITKQWSVLRSISIKRLFRPPKEQGSSAKVLGKRPLEGPVPEAGEASANYPSSSGTNRVLPEAKTATTPEGPFAIDGPSIRSEEAAEFLADIDAESLNTMDKEARFMWMRNKLTLFKTRRAAQSKPIATPMNDTGTMTEASLVLIPSILSSFRRSRELFGLGSLFNLSDRWGTDDHVRRPSSITISERTSEAATIVNDGSGSGLRNSGQGFVQDQRRGSGSPRPFPMQRGRHSWQQHRQPHAEARWSIDSTVIFGDRSGVRGASNRWSRGSTGRTSIVGYTGMRSQSSLHLPLHEADNTDSDNQGSSSPPPPPPPRGNEN